MGTLSTHVLDTSLGRAAEGIGVVLEQGGAEIGDGVTDGDGRVGTIGPDRLGQATTRCASPRAATSPRRARRLLPEVVVVFTIADADQHYHVPVLLNPFGYSTYRGS